MIKIDWEEFDKLCRLQCTLREIASWFDCSEDTIERRCVTEKGMKFADYFDQKRGVGKVDLRRKQFNVAMNGNVAMLIFLGKQYLGQADKVEQSNKHEVNLTYEQMIEKLDKIKE